MANVVEFPKGRGTPGSLIRQLLENEDEIEQLVVVVFKKHPDGTPGAVRSYYTDMNCMELAFAGTVLNYDIQEVLDYNAN